MSHAFEDSLRAELAGLEAASQRRRLRSLSLIDGVLNDTNGRPLVDVSSNDYLGLSRHPLVRGRAAV